MTRRPSPIRSLFTTGSDLPLFSGTPQPAHVEQFTPEETGQAQPLFDLPPVEMRTLKRPAHYPATPALFVNACDWGEYQTSQE